MVLTEPPLDEPVSQHRCVFCGHYHAMNDIEAISRGAEACRHCGRVPAVYVDLDDYIEDLMLSERRRGKATMIAWMGE